MKLKYFLFQVFEKLEIILYIISFTIMLVSCSPQARLDRLIKRHPELKTPDTVTKTETFYIPGTVSEKHFTQVIRDTVIIREGNLIQKYYYSDSTVYLYGECKADTITREVKVPVDKIVPQEKDFPWWFWVICGFGIVSVINVLVVLLNRNR